jgi:methylglutaconyl-CoA hydratase
LPVPVIGRVHGAALGGGSGLAAVCDVVIAADDVIFGFHVKSCSESCRQ